MDMVLTTCRLNILLSKLQDFRKTKEIYTCFFLLSDFGWLSIFRFWGRDEWNSFEHTCFHIRCDRFI